MGKPFTNFGSFCSVFIRGFDAYGLKTKTMNNINKYIPLGLSSMGLAASIIIIQRGSMQNKRGYSTIGLIGIGIFAISFKYFSDKIEETKKLQ